MHQTPDVSVVFQALDVVADRAHALSGFAGDVLGRKRLTAEHQTFEAAVLGPTLAGALVNEPEKQPEGGANPFVMFRGQYSVGNRDHVSLFGGRSHCYCISGSRQVVAGWLSAAPNRGSASG